jgi:hypothetical protein
MYLHFSAQNSISISDSGGEAVDITFSQFMRARNERNGTRSETKAAATRIIDDIRLAL